MTLDKTCHFDINQIYKNSKHMIYMDFIFWH